MTLTLELEPLQAFIEPLWRCELKRCDDAMELVGDSICIGLQAFMVSLGERCSSWYDLYDIIKEIMSDLSLQLLVRRSVHAITRCGFNGELLLTSSSVWPWRSAPR